MIQPGRALGIYLQVAKNIIYSFAVTLLIIIFKNLHAALLPSSGPLSHDIAGWERFYLLHEPLVDSFTYCHFKE
jgi:hypothetical protein